MPTFVNATGLVCRILAASVFFMTLQGLAKSASSDTLTCQLRMDIDVLSKKPDLNVTEWLAFVNNLDGKCEKETDSTRKESLCSLYYEVYKTADLFSDSTPTFDDCSRAKLTLEGLSRNPATSISLIAILEKLCPKK